MKERKRRPTPPLTAGWLRAEAVGHLQRWPASEARVRRLLWKRVRRAQSFHGGDDGQARALVEEVVAGLIEAGVLDDGRFAQLWVESLRRRGTSGRVIRQKLRDKGVKPEVCSAALAAFEPEMGGDAERNAAVAYARRRRLGIYRVPVDESTERRQKDLASMARAGFSFDVANQALRAAPG